MGYYFSRPNFDDIDPSQPSPDWSACRDEERREPCKPEVNGNHSLSVVYSGRFRCVLCGFEFENEYKVVGCAVVPTGRVTIISRGNTND